VEQGDEKGAKKKALAGGGPFLGQGSKGTTTIIKKTSPLREDAKCWGKACETKRSQNSNKKKKKEISVARFG